MGCLHAANPQGQGKNERSRGFCFQTLPKLITSPRSPGPLCGHQRPQGWRWLGTSPHSLSWGIPTIAGL